MTVRSTKPLSVFTATSVIWGYIHDAGMARGLKTSTNPTPFSPRVIVVSEWQTPQFLLDINFLRGTCLESYRVNDLFSNKALDLKYKIRTYIMFQMLF